MLPQRKRPYESEDEVDSDSVSALRELNNNRDIIEALNGSVAKKRYLTETLNDTEYPYWLALDIVPAGTQDKDVGRDQTPIMHLAAALGSTATGKVIDQISIFVKPLSFVRLSPSLGAIAVPAGQLARPSAICGSDEVCPISQSAIEAAGLQSHKEPAKYFLEHPDSPVLGEALAQIIEFCASHLDNATPLIITDGHLAIRNVLHREMSHRKHRIDQHVFQDPLWYKYLDVQTLVKRHLHPSLVISNSHPDLNECAELLGLQFSQIEAQEIFCVCFKDIISRRPGGMQIASENVMEVRQVPWTATPATIATFFAGLNIHPGGVAIRLNEGRRSNAAVVWFTDAEQARLAAARHQHQLPSCALITSVPGSGKKQANATISIG
ncbi:hypothetical protein Ciccas_009514 [Cichlidogyrus casuarinus]|uniref:RRM domain-containing protein n=1 Tax=Cichlidogyrus casuarinus TaxID=1844966 RepID=A0ABD2Q1B1_9PLAT